MLGENSETEIICQATQRAAYFECGSEHKKVSSESQHFRAATFPLLPCE